MQVAVKVPPKDAGDDLNKHFVDEINLMHEIEYHPYVVSFIGQCSSRAPLMLVIEYCSNGNLRDYLRDARNPVKSLHAVTHTDQIRFAAQIAAGMLHLAQRRIIHRDLAA